MPGLFRQIFSGFVGGLGLMVAGCWLGWPAPFLRKLDAGQVPYNLTIEERSWVVALMDFGNVLSPIPTGYMMDCVGRKPTFLATAVIYQISWALVIQAEGSVFLYIARVLAGIGKGMAFTVVPMYLAEIAEVSVRGAISTIFTILLFFGTVFEYLIGPYVSYSLLNYISSLVPLVFFVLVFIMPESPYYLLMKKKRDIAEQAFFWLRNFNPAKEDTTNRRAAVDTELNKMDDQVKKEMEARGRWLDLIGNRGAKRAIAIVMILSVLQRLGGISSMLAYTSITLPPTGGGLGPDQYMVLFGIVLTLANFACMPLIDRLGRVPLLIISTLMLAVLQTTTAVFYFMYHETNINVTMFNWIPYVNLLLFAFGYSLGIGIIPSTFLGELFPTNIRAKAAAVSAIFFAFASFSSNKIYLTVTDSFGTYTMFTMFSIMNLVAAIFTYLFCIETKGKTLAEIQTILNEENRRFSLSQRH